MSGRKKVIESHTVREEMRIHFTKELYRLRENEISELTFSNNLTNIERKFLHELAAELGLKSNSAGVGEKRCITVTKNHNGGSSSNVSNFNPKPATVVILQNRSRKNIPVVNQIARRVNKLDDDNKGVKFLLDRKNLHVTYFTAQNQMKSKPRYKEFLAKRMQLPSYHHANVVCSLVKNNQIVLISGETGCGKSTQVPQYLLDDVDIGPTCRMAVTQPRRLSAISVSERVATERCEVMGSSVGYSIRLESEKSNATQILFITPGVLLRKLQRDRELMEFSHIIIDEAHERDQQTEFLLIILRRLCGIRPDLKLILMSATLHTDKLISYFSSGDRRVPHVHIGGSMFPVQEFFLEHALTFSDYMSMKSNSFLAGRPTESLAALLHVWKQRKRTYRCAGCGSGPFRSPEELGTHAALCNLTGQSVTAASSFPSYEPTLQDVVNAIRAKSAVTASSAARNLRAVNNKQLPPVDSNYDGWLESSVKSVNAHGVTTTATSGTGEEGEGGDAASPQDDDVDEDEVEVVDPETEGIEGTDALQVSTVDDTLVTSAADELLKQYQYMWDDDQVDLELIQSLLSYTCNSEFGKDGAVLVFLPGWEDISRLYRMLTSSQEFGNTSKYLIFQLHSGIPKKNQSEVFLPPPNNGMHKIILSTNIAETSITINDISVVIDSGRLKEKTYDPHIKLVFLKPEWISQASARQRKGRAGRTRAGVCFHLFSKRRYEHLAPFQDSELLRMPLEDLVLQTKGLGVSPGCGDDCQSVTAFLLQAMDPPHIMSIKNAIQSLQALGCMDGTEALTTLGSAVSRIPALPMVARSMLLGSLLGCGLPLIANAAVTSYRDPFLMPVGDAQREYCANSKAQLSQSTGSDQYSVVKAMQAFEMARERFGQQGAERFCEDCFLSRSTMSFLLDLQNQLQYALKENLDVDIHQSKAQRNAGNESLVVALIGISLYPNIAVKFRGSGCYVTEKGRKAKLHPSSVNARSSQSQSLSTSSSDIDIIGYQDLITISPPPGAPTPPPGAASLYMMNTTPISILSLLLCCGSLEEDQMPEEDSPEEFVWEGLTTGRASKAKEIPLETSVVVVDNWLRFRMTKESLDAIISLRVLFGRAISEYLNAPKDSLSTTSKEITDEIIQLLTAEQVQGQPSRTDSSSQSATSGQNNMRRGPPASSGRFSHR